MGDSREVLRELPDEVKSEIGFALERVQQGKMPVNAKPLKGIAPGVLEILCPTSKVARSGPCIQ